MLMECFSGYRFVGFSPTIFSPTPISAVTVDRDYLQQHVREMTGRGSTIRLDYQSTPSTFATLFLPSPTLQGLSVHFSRFRHKDVRLLILEIHLRKKD